MSKAKEILTLNEAVSDIFKKQGWETLSLGGGCEGFLKEWNNKFILITDDDGCDPPDNVNDKVIIGLYKSMDDIGGDPLEYIVTKLDYSKFILKQVIAQLEAK